MSRRYLLIVRRSSRWRAAIASRPAACASQSLAFMRGNFYTVDMNFPAFARISSFLFAFGALAIAAPTPDKTIVLKAARLFDGKSKALVQNGVVIIQGNKIVDAGSNLSAPADAQVIDLGDATLSPGFMDGHTHLTADFSGNFAQRRLDELDLNVSEQAIIATTHARATVEAGFTTVRDLGKPFSSEQRMRRRCVAQFDQQRRSRWSANVGGDVGHRSNGRTFRSDERFSRHDLWPRTK